MAGLFRSIFGAAAEDLSAILPSVVDVRTIVLLCALMIVYTDCVFYWQAQLQRFVTGNDVAEGVRAGDLWKDRDAIVMVVRRPGYLCSIS